MKHLLFCAAALLLPSLAHATVVSLPTDDELVAKSDVIALADVTRVETQRDTKGHIRTLAELRVQRGVRGAAAGDFLIVSYPGGSYNGFTSNIAGVPDLAAGQSVFAYLAAKGSEFVPVGFRYGVLSVTTGRDGTLRATRKTEGLSFVSPLGASAEPKVINNVRVEELVSDITGRMKRLKIDPARARVQAGPNAVPAVRK